MRPKHIAICLNVQLAVVAYLSGPGLQKYTTFIEKRGKRNASHRSLQHPAPNR